MLENLKENTIKLFSETITKLAKIGNIHPSEREEGDNEVKRFSLEELMPCFIGAKKETFLTDKPIEKLLESILEPETGGTPASPPPSGLAKELSEEDFRIESDALPEGTQVTLVICPTDRDGLPLPAKYLDDTQNEAFPYFQLLFSKAEDSSGNSLGMENIWPVPYLNIFPEEFVKETSFIVEYRPGKDRKEGESDFEYLSRMLRKKYARLQELGHNHL